MNVPFMAAPLWLPECPLYGCPLYGCLKHRDLLRPIYKQTARHGHFGRPAVDGAFTWEKTDKAEALAKAAGISMKRAG
jgi:S-adenosylmethionine synthetase